LRNTRSSPETAIGEHNFIIVGSGAGGGPLAVNLAKNGFRVLVLEVGGCTVHNAMIIMCGAKR
jgi:choline dehydrogenase-like flavoprotein